MIASKLDTGDRRARVTDYKTGAVPKAPQDLRLGGGAELQRVLYAVAVAHHRPETQIQARLVFLAEETPQPYTLRGEDLDQALAAAVQHLNAGVALASSGDQFAGSDRSLGGLERAMYRPAGDRRAFHQDQGRGLPSCIRRLRRGVAGAMTEPRDTAARMRALSDFGSTLLVEAAAGTGKTSLLAGRIALLLASGVPPTSIAAITFTRLAADELAGRVRETIDDLLAKRVPRPLQAVLPEGLDHDQRRALEAAAAGSGRPDDHDYPRFLPGDPAPLRRRG
ncbi:UvrD-helicase domain-containing protein [Bradyrhizobium sp. RDT46]|uniref:UvrD-helicase domain-containing protein n=1 Tax=Bradyrhizobium sp. RDT46 TaxID=3341829 RepID=UPI0035C6DA9C